MRCLTGREYPLSSFRPLFSLTDCLPVQSYVWSAVPPPLASIRTQYPFLDLPHTEEDKTKTQCVTRYRLIVFNQYGQLSLMVSTTAIDCRYILSGSRDYASAQLLVGVFSPPNLCRYPILPLPIVFSVSDTCSPGLALIVPTCDYLRLASLSLDDLRALTLLSPHLDIHPLH
jgi:hypothetical protein